MGMVYQTKYGSFFHVVGALSMAVALRSKQVRQAQSMIVSGAATAITVKFSERGKCAMLLKLWIAEICREQAAAELRTLPLDGQRCSNTVHQAALKVRRLPRPK